MNTHADKTTETNSNAAANGVALQQGAEHEGTFQLEDNRPETIAQRKIQDAANNSPQADQLKAVKSLANNSPQVKQLKAVQAMANSNTVQRQVSFNTDNAMPAGGLNDTAVAQLSIGYHLIGGGAAGQFQIDGVRPAWTGAAAGMAAVAFVLDRAHIIAFEVIQNDLANILNDMMNNRGTPAYAGHSARLVTLCDTLFVTPGAERATMVLNRTNLVGTITGLPPGVPNGGNRAALTLQAGILLSNLNSCMDNLRLGNHAANLSIGFSIDADFLPGTSWFHGPVVPMPPGAPVPAAAVPPMGAAVLGPAAGGIGPFQCVRLIPAHEAKVYHYQHASTLPLTFVISGIGGALFPGTPAGMHLSSTQMPTVAVVPTPYPVIVMDPGGVNPPFVFT